MTGGGAAAAAGGGGGIGIIDSSFNTGNALINASVAGALGYTANSVATGRCR